MPTARNMFTPYGLPLQRQRRSGESMLRAFGAPEGAGRWPLAGLSDHGKEMAPLGAPSASSAFFCRLPRRRSRDLSAVAWHIFGAHHLHDISGMFRAFSPLACFESHPLALQARLVWYAPSALRRTRAIRRWRSEGRLPLPIGRVIRPRQGHGAPGSAERQLGILLPSAASALQRPLRCGVAYLRSPPLA